MNDIDRYLDQACRQVNGPDSLRAHLRQELKEHLEEATRALVAEGMSAGEATAKAIEDLGDPEIIRDGMQTVYGPGVTSLFVEQAIKWKEKKWHRLAQIVLTMIVILAVVFVYFVMINVVPLLQKLYEEVDLELVGFQVPIIVSSFGYNHWYLCLIGVAAAIGLFEWKCRSDSKPLIRTLVLVGSSLVTVIFALWVAFLAVVAFAVISS